ncbi:MAG: glycoside hydrolase family 31 protein [Clostridiales bacterium]|nr:glycoside hydrolase family 31 protein [Clostridiales bacterium]
MYSLTKYARTLSEVSATENTLNLSLVLTEFAESPLTESGRECGRMRVELSSPQSGIIKITSCMRYTGKDQTRVIATRPSGAASIESDDNTVTLKTGMLEAKVSKTGTFRIVFSYCGVPITATSLNAFFSTKRPDQYTGACIDIAPGESFFGLGGAGTIDLIGRKEETNNSRESAAFDKIPFFVSSRGYGIFVNSFGSVKFDFASQNGSISFAQEGETLEFYLFAANTPADVINSYAGLIGKDPTIELPTDGLALDYGNNYEFTQDSLISDIDQATDLGVKISEIWLGSGYLSGSLRTGYTWDYTRFPDPGKLIRKLHDRNIKIGVSLTPYLSDATSEYAECVDNDFLVKDEDGSILLADYDQGSIAIVDVTNQSARNWLGLKFDSVLQIGIDLVEADFKYEIFNVRNRPVSFYNRFAVAFNEIVKDCASRCIGSDRDNIIKDSTGAGDSISPYRNIYMNKNTASYSSLACAVNNALSYGMTGCGIVNMDVPSIATVSPTLYTRWFQTAMLMPHFRLPVPFCKDSDMLANLKLASNIRTSLMAYIESCCAEAVNYGLPVVRPMQVEFATDKLAVKCSNQFMLGSSVMVCPVYSGAGNVSFYVPAGNWTNFLTREVITGPRIVSRKADLTEIPLYIRPNSILTSHTGDTITFSCFDLVEGKVAASEVFGSNKSFSGVVNVLKQGGKITVKTDGFGRTAKRIVLTGIKNVVSVSEGFPNSDGYGTTVEFDSNELVITLG